MFAGLDFPSQFDKDNFAVRRNNSASAGNAYDPESLLSGSEINKGLTYLNSAREWVDEGTYLRAVSAEFSPEKILEIAPRQLTYGRMADTEPEDN